MEINLDYLLELLNERFPNKLPRSTEVTVEELRLLQGHQIVIDYIANIEETERRKKNGGRPIKQR